MIQRTLILVTLHAFHPAQEGIMIQMALSNMDTLPMVIQLIISVYHAMRAVPLVKIMAMLAMINYVLSARALIHLCSLKNLNAWKVALSDSINSVSQPVTSAHTHAKTALEINSIALSVIQRDLILHFILRLLKLVEKM